MQTEKIFFTTPSSTPKHPAETTPEDGSSPLSELTLPIFKHMLSFLFEDPQAVIHLARTNKIFYAFISQYEEFWIGFLFHIYFPHIVLKKSNSLKTEPVFNLNKNELS